MSLQIASAPGNGLSRLRDCILRDIGDSPARVFFAADQVLGAPGPSFNKESNREVSMPLLFLIAVGAGVVTVGSVVLDPAHTRARQSAQALTFEATRFDSQADCLTAAAADGLPLSSCRAQE